MIKFETIIPKWLQFSLRQVTFIAIAALFPTILP